jgi:MFS transporter, putative metabolite:H+ symporter
VPNIVRGMVVPITMLFQISRARFGLEAGALLVGALCMVVALVALAALEEAFHKDLDYFEEFL